MKPFYLNDHPKDSCDTQDFYVPKKDNKKIKKETKEMDEVRFYDREVGEELYQKVSNFEKRFPGKKPMLNMYGLKQHIFDVLNAKGLTLPDGHVPEKNWDEFMDLNRKYIAEVDFAIERLIETLLAEKLKVCTEETVLQKSGIGVHSAKNNTGDGTKTKPVSLVEITGKYSKEKLSQVKGSKSRGSAKNPELFDTYKDRVSCLRSRCRALVLKESGEFVYSEKEINEITDLWTKNYNKKFGTNFEPYYSKRGYAPVRD